LGCVARVKVPEEHRAIQGTGGQVVPIPAEGDGCNSSLRPAHLPNRRARSWIVYSDIIPVSCKKRIAIRAVGDPLGGHKIIVLGIALPLAALIKTAPKESCVLDSSAKAREQPATKGFWSGAAARQPSFWLLFLIWLQVPLAIQLWQVHFFPHVSDRGIAETAASLLFVFSGTGLIVGRVSWGALADRFGSMKTLAFVFLLLCGAQLSSIGVWELWHVYLVAALFGFSMGGNDTVYVKLVVETFGPQFAGTIIGALTFAFALSSSLGPLIAGSIVDHTKSYSWSFLIASIALLVALITLYFLNLSIQARPRDRSELNILAET